ncbi:MAG: hypothetical protein U1F66_00680 [bacterium]
MRISIKTALLACCLLLGSAQVWAQPAPCDPASAPLTPGSCQFPNTTFPNGGPDCYVCQAVIGGPNVCVPDDTVCEGMAGGDSDPNICRIAICTPGATNRSNPSGCEYFIDPSPTPIPQCFLCNDSTAPFSNHCPNGACEPGLGETIATCQLDCLVPGMTPTPLPTQTQMDNACTPPGITFDGPPFNVGGTGSCEDGNVCTTDSCVGSSCVHTNNRCSIDTSDLCCPSGCTPPPAGGICGNNTNCDVDCKQIDCPVPSPSPTPTPVPPPFVGCLEGSGGFGHSKSGPGCGGFACSLNPAASPLPGFGFMLALASALGLGAYRGLRKRRG